MRTSVFFLAIAAAATAATVHFHRQPLTPDSALGLFGATIAAGTASLCAVGSAGDSLTTRRSFR